MKNLRPLPKEITDDIRFILEGCRNGKLKHDQGNFFCETSRCIAGWKLSLDNKWDNSLSNNQAETRTEELFTKKSIAKLEDNPYDSPIFGYAQWKWGLTSIEAEVLFSGSAAYEGQFALLEWLESGKRLSTIEDLFELNEQADINYLDFNEIEENLERYPLTVKL